MNTPVTQIFHLDDPKQARDFLANLWIGDRKIDFVRNEAGEEIFFKDCTDEQAVAFATQIADMEPTIKKISLK